MRNNRQHRPADCVRGGSQRGGALLAVLWLSVALSAIAFSVATSVRGETERTTTATDSLRAYYLAAGSVERAMLSVYWGTQFNFSNPDGSPRYFKPPMSFLRYSYATGDVLVELLPETGKLNINTATPEDIARVLNATGIDGGRAAAIAQGIVAYRSVGGSNAGASGLDSTFRSRNASLEELEEILLVPEMTPDLFFGRFDRDSSGRLFPRGGLRECFTVFGESNVIDVNTAPPLMLAALGLSPAAIEQIVARRTVTPFKSVGELASLIPGAGGLASRLGIPQENQIWTIRATARVRLPDGKLSDVRRTVSAVVKYYNADKVDLNPPYRVLRWYDDAWSPGVIPF